MSEQVVPFPTPEENTHDRVGAFAAQPTSRPSSERPAMNMALDTDDMEAQFEESLARFEDSTKRRAEDGGEPITVRVGGGPADSAQTVPAEHALVDTLAEGEESVAQQEIPQAFYKGEPVLIQDTYTNDAGEQVMAVTRADDTIALVYGKDIEYPHLELDKEETASATEVTEPEVQLLIEEGEEEKLLEAEATPEPLRHKEWNDIERYKFQEISGNTFWAAKWNAAQRGNEDFILNFGVEPTDTSVDVERKRQENRVILIAGGSALVASELQEAAINELYVNDKTRVLFEAVAYEVGFKVLQNLTDRQLGEYEAIVNADQSVIDAWLEQHIPDYKTSPVYQQIEAGYESDPEKNDPAKLFAGIAWLQENSPAYEEIANEVVSEFTPRFEEIEEKEQSASAGKITVIDA